MSVIERQRTPDDDREADELLRTFDRTVARLAELRLDVLKLRGYVPADDHRGAVSTIREYIAALEQEREGDRRGEAALDTLRVKAEAALHDLGGQ